MPQFLQRGFVSHVVGGEAFTWVHRKDAQPFNTNLKNAGVEGFFYSVGQDTELDDAITDFEGEFSPLILDLRCGASRVTADTLRIAQLLAHLEMRTRHLRQSFLETGTHLLDELMKFASDEEAFGRYFRRAIQRDNSLMQDAMAKEVRKYGIPLQYLPKVIEISGPLIERMLPKTLSQMSEFAKQFRNSFPGTLKEAAKAGQIKAMLGTLAPESKVDRFVGLEFQVLESVGPPLALGDSVVLFQVAGERAFKPFLECEDELVAVYLPLSPQQVLVGSNVSFALDPACLRREIARCSLEHFVASEAPPVHCDLLPLIGENAHLLSIDQVGTIMHELREK
ncbi:DUF4238 domain-containing protein [Ectopseudomonas hydrolytica]|uniref:DUF4238 domain-containing protein n=1 Tax=Ectopseudomonas hydrolytica TaxID=2493633 RepID=UPI003EE4219F